MEAISSNNTSKTGEKPSKKKKQNEIFNVK